MMKLLKRSSGFSLIEVMISLTIALVAILAATALYSGTRQTYRIQEMQNRLTEDGRFAISMLQRVIAQAGFKPTTDPETLWGALGAYIEPTSATEMTVRFIGDGVNQIACNGSLAAGDSQLVISRPGNNLDCDGEAWIDSAGSGSELIDFLLEYGSDNAPDTDSNYGCGPSGGTPGTLAGDCVADTYDWAIADGAPDRIVAVRACLVLRSRTTDASIIKAANYEDCSGNDIASSQTDNRLYRTFRTTVLLRNR
jgi:type IV pilus assembly protein PilW